MRTVQIHVEHGCPSQDLAGRMGPQSADGFEADLEKLLWIR